MTGKIPYRNFIFIPVFFSFYIVLKSIDASDLLLTHFDERSISVATAEGIDIGARVTIFYKSLLFLGFLLFALTKLATIVQSLIPREELQLMNGLSLAGFCLLFFRILGAEVRPSMHIIFALTGILAIGSVFHQVRKRTETKYTIAFLWSALMAISLFFLQWYLLRFTSVKFFLSLPLTLLFSGSILYLFSTNIFSLNYNILRTTYPLIFIPLLVFISMEGVMILNQRGINIQQWTIFLTGFICIISYALYSLKRYKGVHPGVSHEVTLFRNWIPWMLAGMLCIAFYSPVVKAEMDLFETANNILPLHQWYNFGKVPFVDTFNAHTFSDFGAGWLYSVFNGLDPMGYFVYRFLVQVVVLLLVYFMIYKMTGDGFLAIWLTLAYPYTNHILPSYFNLVPLAVIAFIRLYEKQTVGRYMFYFGTLAFMVFWRVDLGMSVLIAGVLSLLILVFIIPSFKVAGRNFYRASLFTISLLFVFFLLALFNSGSNLFLAINDILGYLSSYQSYGLMHLSVNHDLHYYSLYFFLPSVVILIVAATIYKLRSGALSGNTAIIALVIIFLGIFYFSNFQRGLVRHTLYEQWNMALTSFGFFIIGAYVLLLSHKRSADSRFLIFFITSTLLVANYVYREPDLKTNNNYFSLAEKIYAAPFSINGTEKISRIESPSHGYNSFAELKSWLDEKFPKGTFMDFSNTPMLYYYTNRILPTYFIQSPHTAHNDYLQKRFIEDLSRYNIPVAIFSNVPHNFWDNLDGIPNTLRHYYISEYLYREYKPAFIIDGHSIWIKKSIPLPDEREIFSVPPDSLKTAVKFENGYYTVTSDRGFLDYKFLEPLPNSGKLYSTISLNAGNSGEMVVYYRSPDKEFDGKRKSHAKYIKGSNQLFLLFDQLMPGEQLSEIKFELPANAEVSFSEIKIYESELYHDHFSTQPVTASLKLIPFIWGTYDKNYREDKIQLQQSLINSPVNFNDKPVHIDFLPIKERENGNYLRLNIRCISEKQPELSVSYGSGDRTNGTFNFTLKNDSAFHDYLVRISSQYGWYNNENTWLTVSTSGGTVEIKAADILKGD